MKIGKQLSKTRWQDTERELRIRLHKTLELQLGYPNLKIYFYTDKRFIKYYVESLKNVAIIGEYTDLIKTIGMTLYTKIEEKYYVENK